MKKINICIISFLCLVTMCSVKSIGYSTDDIYIWNKGNAEALETTSQDISNEGNNTTKNENKEEKDNRKKADHFGEDHMLLDAQGKVAAAVEAAIRDAAEVAHAGQSEVHELVQEVPHAFLAERHAATDGPVSYTHLRERRRGCTWFQGPRRCRSLE